MANVTSEACRSQSCPETPITTAPRERFRFGLGDTLRLSIVASIRHDVYGPNGVEVIDSVSEGSVFVPAGRNPDCTLLTAARALVEHLVSTASESLVRKIMAALAEIEAKRKSPTADAEREAAAELRGEPPVGMEKL